MFHRRLYVLFGLFVLFVLLVSSLFMACSEEDLSGVSVTVPTVPCVYTNGIDITTYSELVDIRDDLDGNYCLGNDIDATDEADWVAVGSDGDPFTGKFNGQGNEITGLNIVAPSGKNYVGFFGWTDNAEIKNLTLEKPTLVNTSYEKNIGILAGSASGSTTIHNVHVVDGKASLEVGAQVGGLVGYAKDTTTITNCSVSGGSVEGAIYVGGLVGTFSASSGKISNSFSTASVKGVNYVGGLVGGVSINADSVVNCYATGLVTAGRVPPSSSDHIGGLIGYYDDDRAKGAPATLTANYYDPGTSGQPQAVGYGTVTSSEITALPSANIIAETNFANWDFTTIWNWKGVGKYPTLK